MTYRNNNFAEGSSVAIEDTHTALF